jgi:hypothetical protein
VNAFLLAQDAEPLMGLIDAAGFAWVRQQIHWRDLNGDGVKFDWSQLDVLVARVERHGQKLLLSIVRSPDWASPTNPSGLPADPRDFADFLGLLATRYQGRVAAYEIWNEPNLALENGGLPADPAHYLDVLLAARPAIKRADPQALVLAAPLAATATADRAIAADDLHFYEQLYRARDGAFLQAADIVAVHSGGGDRPPSAGWPSDNPAASRRVFRHLEALRVLMERHDDRRPVWVTEFGWTVTRVPGAPPPVSQQQQADYILGAIELTRERYPWIEAVFVWNLNFAVLGPPSDEKSAFGILNPDGSPRPAYLALRRALTGQTTAPPRYQPSSPAPPPTVSLATVLPRAPSPPPLDPAAPALDLAWSPDGKLLASAAWDGRLRVWDERGRLLETLVAHERPARALAWSPDGEFLASAGWDGRVRVFARAGWRDVATLEGHVSQVAGLAWSERDLLSWGWDGLAIMWARENWRLRVRVEAGPGPITSAAWQPGGAAFATGGWDGRVRVWATSGAQLYKLPGMQGDVEVLAWSPDGLALAAAGPEGSLRVWDGAASSNPRRARHPAGLSALAWSPDGAQLASAGRDGVLLVFDADERLRELSVRHAAPVWALAWSPDGARLASGSADGRLLVQALTDDDRGAEYLLEGPIWALAWRAGGDRLATAAGSGGAAELGGLTLLDTAR